jgi:hypothetical protein
MHAARRLQQDQLASRLTGGNGTGSALALAVSSAGTFAQIATHELIPVDQINRTSFCQEVWKLLPSHRRDQAAVTSFCWG